MVRFMRYRSFTRTAKTCEKVNIARILSRRIIPLTALPTKQLEKTGHAFVHHCRIHAEPRRGAVGGTHIDLSSAAFRSLLRWNWGKLAFLAVDSFRRIGVMDGAGTGKFFWNSHGGREKIRFEKHLHSNNKKQSRIDGNRSDGHSSFRCRFVVVRAGNVWERASPNLTTSLADVARARATEAGLRIQKLPA